MKITRNGRFWALHDESGELIALTVYKKGAQNVARRIAPDKPISLPQRAARIYQPKAVYSTGK